MFPIKVINIIAFLYKKKFLIVQFLRFNTNMQVFKYNYIIKKNVTSNFLFIYIKKYY